MHYQFIAEGCIFYLFRGFNTVISVNIYIAVDNYFYAVLTIKPTSLLFYQDIILQQIVNNGLIILTYLLSNKIFHL